MDRLPHGRLSLFPDCGHLPHVEHPDRFAAVLSDWLTEHHEPVLTQRLHHPLDDTPRQPPWRTASSTA